ncbi:hypothetical protein GOC91_20720 [Sinorhizobium medicae]|uniref:Uncharacterized protein n=2 Tax=Sinorhizobium medicae TaxID=110321 RepID=A6U7V6_SINMW|nr:hypothetical protein Smed_0881 [Sinorhizobium medicae WSM419]MDX0407381.1 hypothetical protein [Sinorhizobium medicae]MDX0413567.1 hypothetical protein [Sinorhizobium medicae]MDX0419311.1 hypothetical protein [Sinorhizobium medicae]MDX0424696.1 hypothetical protein [Sinorhizobium medicae]
MEQHKVTLNIRNQEADDLARELARIDRTSITDAVISALRETIRNRMRKESPRETAQTILARRGLAFQRIENRCRRKPITTLITIHWVKSRCLSTPVRSYR